MASIFKDRSKLSPRYIPERLPHRERQIEGLLSLYEYVLDDVENAFLQVTQIVGGVGTGKTCTAVNFGRRIEKEASGLDFSLKHIYVNAKVEGTSRYVLYRRILEKTAPAIASRSLSPEEMLFQLVRYLKDEKEYVILTIDEIDYLCKRGEHVIYDLTRLNEISPGEPINVLGILLISRDLSYYKFLEPSELSTLGRYVIEFPRYTSNQIKDILWDRVKLAFKPGAINDEVLEFISDLTVKPPFNGDVRVALDLLLYSGNLAENLGFNRILPEHVRRVHAETHPGITTEDILDLSDRGKLVLLGLVRALKNQKKAYVGLREIREGYEVVCEEQGIKPTGEVEDYMQDLIDRGIVSMKSLREFGISDVPAEDLERFLNGVMQRLKG
ncbi:MAG: AAA family ATPase [Candidatus Bathyarchaeia archaeon]